MDIAPYYRIKCVFVGEPSVGKSSIIHLVHHEEQNKNVEPTIGIGFANTQINLEEYPISNPSKLPHFYKEKSEVNSERNQLVSLYIWDTAGSLRFFNIVKSYLRDVDICFLVFDLTRRSTFDDVVRWKEEVDNSSEPIYILVGTKSDLKNPEVSISEIRNLAQNWNIKYYILSAVQFDSYTSVRKMLYNSVREFHENLLKLEHQKKKLPDHVLTSYYEKKFDLVDFYDTSRGSFCCYQ